MAIKKLLADLNIISKLGDNPGSENGLSADQLKAKFDEAANIIKDYINNHLITELDKIIDVEALLNGILDSTLSKADKAANAKAAGDEIRKVRAFVDKAIRGGDYVLPVDGFFSASVTGDTTIRVNGGSGVMQGNLFDVNVGGYEDISIQPGTYGLNRADLICVHCEPDGDGGNSFSFSTITGANTSAVDPPDPEYAAGDINEGTGARDFPLYRVVLNGYDIVGLVKVFHVRRGVDELTQFLPSTLGAEWAGDGPFTQTVAVPGIPEDAVSVTVWPVWGDTAEVREAQREAWSMISKINPSAGSIEFICDDDKPDVAVPVTVEVHL